MRLTILAGLPKTGSSFLQSALVDLADHLADAGIRYPFLATSEVKLRRVGNGKEIHQKILYKGSTESATEDIIQSADASKPSLLLAHEGFYNSLPFLKEQHLQTLRQHGFEKIRIIVYFREPKQWAFRVYKQRVRSGRILSFAKFWESWGGVEAINRLIDWVAANSEMVTAKWFPYEEVSASLLKHFLTDGLLIYEEKARALEECISRQIVNRSLSLREIRFIQTVGQVSPRVARRTSLLLERFAIRRSDRAGYEKFCSMIPAECDSICLPRWWQAWRGRTVSPEKARWSPDLR